MSAATTRSRTPDRLCAEAVDLARSAAQEVAAPGIVGEHVSVVADGDRVVTHLFECRDFGYRGWRWAVTVTRASRAKVVTLDEAVLLPGPDALLAPEWVPWSERLRPGDMGPGDLLPTEADDLRLEPGYTGADQEPPNAPDSVAVREAAEDAEDATGPASGAPAAAPEAAPAPAPAVADALPPGMASGAVADLVEAEDAELNTPDLPSAVPARARIASVAEELGMGRPRVLSRYGLHIAADRWDEEFGPKTAMAQAAPAPCVSCGFLVPLGGSLRQAFGICANEFSPADGRVVSLAYGCGGHSEAAVMPKPPVPPAPVLDTVGSDSFPLHPSREEGSVPASAEQDGSEDLGHS
ncbi:DUF3027 domain-containing protein [Streptomyces fuscigenes]|uniref:DUF3027 domain-containing protein n=1 Tax=Streptomyces fuscigenes TaxID=1528880 RepID=UPI001F201E07|nr:DUF3027 domain-containing protein [Streptomyces fuscigenes]MCF3964832.1 DUF3027 domain-containing protein [Streptomyces fuscigenes]